MSVQARDFSHLKGLEKISDGTLKDHFGLYEGYVKALNKIQEALEGIDSAQANYTYSRFTELKRRYAVAYNGVHLHELYFDNLSPESSTGPSEKLEKKLSERWGSFENWKEEVIGLSAAGPGWILTAYDQSGDRLENLLVSEHHTGIPVGHTPVLVLDVWEHAFLKDFSTDKESYAKAFFENVSWKEVNRRFQHAVEAAPIPSPDHVTYVKSA